MPSPPKLPDFEFDSDPEIEARLAEREAQMKSFEAEYAAREPERLQGSEFSRETEPAPPPTDPALQAKFDQMVAEYGLPLASSPQPADVGGILREVVAAAGKIAQEIAAPRPAPKPSAEPQWYYVRGEKRVGPIGQRKLLELLETEELAWTALVWRRTMKDWQPALDTELGELAGPGAPPPLPPPPSS